LVGDAAFALIVASRAIKQAIDFCLRDAVVAAGRFLCAQFSVVNPLLDGGDS
jgi:hypothetical protein